MSEIQTKQEIAAVDSQAIGLKSAIAQMCDPDPEIRVAAAKTIGLIAESQSSDHLCVSHVDDQPTSFRSHSLGLQVCEPTTVPVSHEQYKASAENFALLLAEDAEQNFDKMIPVTQDMLSEAMAFLDEVGLD
jgi:hypothetical protein